ncbi:hypothetical protein C8F04DRAFT_1198498 [Mycena alexandri]|uniref:Uncharacterized protein n=1 Tax=Mycena alexandri TaxID=1745969 RepID=A0AAD6S1H9_9AGAR|nr:hypothetical protein C8F04DRAFT_1198498 [Mycena alexandri]
MRRLLGLTVSRPIFLGVYFNLLGDWVHPLSGYLLQASTARPTCFNVHTTNACCMNHTKFCNFEAASLNPGQTLESHQTGLWAEQAFWVSLCGRQADQGAGQRHIVGRNCPSAGLKDSGIGSCECRGTGNPHVYTQENETPTREVRLFAVVECVDLEERLCDIVGLWAQSWHGDWLKAHVSTQDPSHLAQLKETISLQYSPDREKEMPRVTYIVDERQEEAGIQVDRGLPLYPTYATTTINQVGLSD